MAHAVDQRIWAEIDLDAIAHNMRLVRGVVPYGAKLMAVVKADGYGHGAPEISGVLLSNGADAFGVAVCGEGVRLREAGVTVPILVLGRAPACDHGAAVEHGLSLTIINKKDAALLSGLAVRRGATAGVHVKIDTGLNRLGFAITDDTADDIEYVCSLPNLRVEGIFTHFAVSESAAYEDADFTRGQYEKFTRFIDALRRRGIMMPVSHVSNSGAVLNHPEMSCGMARPGLLLYGMTPAGSGVVLPGLRPAMKLSARVSRVFEIGPGESVSYGRTYRTEGVRRIATVAAGYADGYPRSLGNRGRVIVNGSYADVVGTVCMDLLTIDVTGVGGVRVDDEAILIGSDGTNSITADEVARHAGTVNYEIVCGINKRVPRAYVRNGTVCVITGGFADGRDQPSSGLVQE